MKIKDLRNLPFREWNIPNALPNYSLRNDMFYPSGVICFWSNDCAFKVGASLSSTDIYLVKK